jgi:hypothetical protein
MQAFLIKWAIQAGIVALLCAYSFFGGVRYESSKHALDALVAERKIRDLEHERATQSDHTITKYIEKVKYVQSNNKAITRMESSLPSCDSSGNLAGSYRVLHDAAASNSEADPAKFANASVAKPQEFAATCIDNYATYHQVKAQCEALQEWAKEVSK